ncbi:UNVERIFIED_CONTAM: hypothetical protein NCL1_44803 [Trichonephila clavipes]
MEIGFTYYLKQNWCCLLLEEHL